jgi:hypothetical protein
MVQVALYHPAPTSSQYGVYHCAFALGITDNPRIHQDDLSPPSRSWKDLHNHQFGKEFEEAARREYQSLKERDTFQVVPKTADIKPIPLTRVFAYKVDNNGFFTKFKARICVGDLQPKDKKDTYAATLAARVFRALMAIAAAQNLEAYQLDANLAFVNSKLDETIYCKCPC